MEQKWIDTKKCMPDDFTDVLVYFEYYRYGTYNRLYKTIGIGRTCDGQWLFINGTTGWERLKVIAWMPLPEPPKGI